MNIEQILKRFLHLSSNNLKKVTPHNLKGKNVSSQQWLTRQLTDPYVQKAKTLNYRCRSAFKLIEIDDRFNILKPGQTVIDCGAAPGSWTQVAVDKVNAQGVDAHESKGFVLGVDKQQFYPVTGATVLCNSDFTLDSTQDEIRELLQGRSVQVVLSDMAPNASGIREMDTENIVHLCYTVLRFAVQISSPEATLLVKLWETGERKALENDISKFYNNVRVVKPDASRSDSAEIFLLGRGFKGLKNG